MTGIYTLYLEKNYSHSKSMKRCDIPKYYVVNRRQIEQQLKKAVCVYFVRS